MQLALFLQVAKNKLLWAKLMSGFTCFILFLDLNSWPGWRAKKSCIVMILIKKILEFSTSISSQWQWKNCFLPLEGKAGLKIKGFFIQLSMLSNEMKCLLVFNELSIEYSPRKKNLFGSLISLRFPLMYLRTGCLNYWQHFLRLLKNIVYELT